jgi:hypothetical protein
MKPLPLPLWSGFFFGNSPCVPVSSFAAAFGCGRSNPATTPAVSQNLCPATVRSRLLAEPDLDCYTIRLTARVFRSGTGERSGALSTPHARRPRRRSVFPAPPRGPARRLREARERRCHGQSPRVLPRALAGLVHIRRQFHRKRRQAPFLQRREASVVKLGKIIGREVQRAAGSISAGPRAVVN